MADPPWPPPGFSGAADGSNLFGVNVPVQNPIARAQQPAVDSSSSESNTHTGSQHLQTLNSNISTVRNLRTPLSAAMAANGATGLGSMLDAAASGDSPLQRLEESATRVLASVQQLRTPTELDKDVVMAMMAAGATDQEVIAEMTARVQGGTDAERLAQSRALLRSALAMSSYGIQRGSIPRG